MCWKLTFSHLLPTSFLTFFWLPREGLWWAANCTYRECLQWRSHGVEKSEKNKEIELSKQFHMKLRTPEEFNLTEKMLSCSKCRTFMLNSSPRCLQLSMVQFTTTATFTRKRGKPPPKVYGTTSSGRWRNLTFQFWRMSLFHCY